MSRFNLLDEKWISVIVEKNGKSEEVSLIELFQNCHKYYALAGDTKTQDFAVMRVLLAILHTVFSRFNSTGDEYGYFELDEKYLQIEKIDEDSIEDYKNDLLNTWIDLWKKESFPKIVIDYLEKWREHFYLFDEKYPFFQVIEDEINSYEITVRGKKSKATTVYGKNINRLISESGNKIALFSPKYEMDSNKEKLSNQEIVRWLITFQGYTGLSEKAIFGKEKYTAAKGWLFDIGGIYFTENNLFKTLMLNLVLVHPEEIYSNDMQTPCWESSGKENIQKSLEKTPISNISQLYTNWSRAIYIDPSTDINKAFEFDAVNLPDINHQDLFLEPMTLWRYNNNGELKGKFTPKKHSFNQSLWRSFGLITISNDTYNSKEKILPQKNPIIIKWLRLVSKYIGKENITLNSISMEYDGNPNSRLPKNEIYDSLNINDIIITEDEKAGWVQRINDTVEDTKDTISKIYYSFIEDIEKIRKLDSKDFVNRQVENLYYEIDAPFREWIESITPEDSKDEKIFQWREILYKIVKSHAYNLIKNANPRDFTGLIENKKTGKKEMLNIPIAYNSFIFKLNKKLQGFVK